MLKEYYVETKEGAKWMTKAQLKRLFYNPIADNGGSKIIGIIHDIDDSVVFAYKDCHNDKMHLHIVKLHYFDNDTIFYAGGVKYSLNEFWRV